MRVGLNTNSSLPFFVWVIGNHCEKSKSNFDWGLFLFCEPNRIHALTSGFLLLLGEVVGRWRFARPEQVKYTVSENVDLIDGKKQMSQVASGARGKRILVVGGVAAGASAATRARRLDSRAEIVIFEKGPVVSFANCGLPYHLGGEIADRKKLIVASSELFWNRFEIEVRTMHEVTKIDRSSKTITVKDRSQGGEEVRTERYDKLILAMGAEPFLPPFAKPLPSNAFQLWTLADMDGILAYLQGNSVRRVVVVGAGFVGVEVVEQLHHLGKAVELIELSPTVLSRLDRVFGTMAGGVLKSHGVGVRTGVSIERFEMKEGKASGAVLSDGQKVEADLFILGVGVRPRTALAVEAGIELGAARGISVNSFQQTNDSDVYAAGDLIEYTQGVTGSKGLNPLAGAANRAGRIAGEHAVTGESTPMGNVLGTSIVRLFETTVAMTGMNERGLEQQGISYRTAIIQAAQHASYFPGAVNMQLKILYEEPSGKLLGAQAIGGEGVDKRIDILATAMHFGGTVYDLAKLDLAYAPPYGSAKDPVHMAAFTAINDLKGFPRLLLPDADLSGMQVVDVRTAKERQELPLEGSVAIPIDEFPKRAGELDLGKPTVVVCHSGKRAHVGACRLKALGFQEVYNLTGGMSIRSLCMPQTS